MVNTLDILYNVTGQYLVFDAPEGRPSSVTSSTVYENTEDDTSTAESATTGSAAVEDFAANPNETTTFDAASGDGQANARVANLTSTTGIVKGRTYLATTAIGQKEWITVTEITAGVSITSLVPLVNAYASSDTFASTRISHAVDSTWVANVNNVSSTLAPTPRYRWRLVYVVDSVTYVHAVYFDLVRYSGTHTVTGLDVDAYFPGWLDRLPTYYREDQGARIITAAYRAVKMDLYGVAKADQMARNGEVIDDLVTHKAGLLGAQSLDDQQVAESRYQARFKQLIVQPKIEFATTGGGGGREVSPLPVLRR